MFDAQPLAFAPLAAGRWRALRGVTLGHGNTHAAVERPQDWVDQVNRPETQAELEALQTCVQRGRPFGNKTWVGQTVKLLGLESTMRFRGRPKGS